MIVLDQQATADTILPRGEKIGLGKSQQSYYAKPWQFPLLVELQYFPGFPQIDLVVFTTGSQLLSSNRRKYSFKWQGNSAS